MAGGVVVARAVAWSCRRGCLGFGMLVDVLA